MNGVRVRMTMACRRAAFTIIEVLVVVTIIVVLLAIAVPSFQSMLYSTEQSLSDNALRQALQAARNAALRGGAGRDAAAVFTFEPGGATTVITCVKVAEMDDVVIDTGAAIRREIFVPAAGFTPVRLPKGWMVRGSTPPGSVAVNGDWYDPDRYPTGQVNWVFPETGFYPTTQLDKGRDRSTFMVRFQAGSGVLAGGSIRPALVLLPSTTATGRNNPPFSTWNAVGTEWGGEPERFVQAVLGDGSLSPTERQQLIGRRSSDMVLARPVMQLALYDERRLAAALKRYVNPDIDIDRDSGCLYKSAETIQAQGGASAVSPQFVGSLRSESVTSWTEGDTNLDRAFDGAGGTDQPEARLLTIDRYTGAVRRMETQP